MEKKKLKFYLLLISFAIGLVLIVVHFEDILHGVGLFIRLLMPLFIGIMLAFVLNRPYEIVREWYQKRFKLKMQTAKVLAIVTVYVFTFGAVALIVSIMVPELIRNLKTFTASANQYLLEAQNSLNQFTAYWGLRSVDLSELMEAVDQ